MFIYFIVLLAISSMFLPIYSFDLSDVLEKNGITDYQVNWKKDMSLIIESYETYDFNLDEEKPVYIRYKFLIFDIYSSGEDTFGDYSAYNSFSENNINPNLSGFVLITTTFIFIGLFLYFIYCIFNKIQKNKTRYYLYCAVLILIILISYILFKRSIFENMDINNLGYLDSLEYGIGFYTYILAIVLLLVAYHLQSYLLQSDLKKVKS